MGDFFNSYNQKPRKASNFIEALREQTSSATSSIIGSALDQLKGRNQDQTNLNQKTQPFNFTEFLKSREHTIRQQETSLNQQQRRTETLVFYKKEEEAKKEIEFIKTEIKKIIETTQDIAVELIEAEKAVMMTTVETGSYQLNFFQRIHRLIA